MRSNMKNLYYDVVIAGCGVAGALCGFESAGRNEYSDAFKKRFGKL